MSESMSFSGLHRNLFVSLRCGWTFGLVTRLGREHPLVGRITQAICFLDLSPLRLADTLHDLSQC